jgi:Cu+-exporting ATPase
VSRVVLLRIIKLMARLTNEQLVPPILASVTPIPGVDLANLPFPHTHLYLRHSPVLASLRTIIDVLAVEFPQLSFLPISSDNTEQSASLQRHKETALWRRMLVISACFAVPVFVISMLAMYMPMWLMGWTMWRIYTGIYLGDLMCLFLTIPVQCFLAKRFYVNAWKAVKHKSATM